MIKIQIKSVFGDVLFEYEKENNTIKETLIEAIKRNANLSNANLSYANLSNADLRDADLRGANLRDADLRDANLRDADLRDANLDFAMLYFACKSLKPKTTEKQRIQLCFHFLSWIANADDATDEEKAMFEFCKEYANRFHRTDVGRL